MQLDEQTFDEIATEAFYDEMSKLGYDEDTVIELSKEAGVKAMYDATKEGLKTYGREMASAAKQIFSGAKKSVSKPEYLKNLTRKQKKSLAQGVKDVHKKSIKLHRKAGRGEMGAGFKNKAMRNTLLGIGGTGVAAGGLTGAYQLGKKSK